MLSLLLLQQMLTLLNGIWRFQVERAEFLFFSFEKEREREEKNLLFIPLLFPFADTILYRKIRLLEQPRVLVRDPAPLGSAHLFCWRQLGACFMGDSWEPQEGAFPMSARSKTTSGVHGQLF